MKGSPFELRVHRVSAEKSSLGYTPFIFSEGSVTITAVDQDGTPLTQGGDKFTTTLSVNGQYNDSLVFLLLLGERRRREKRRQRRQRGK